MTPAHDPERLREELARLRAGRAPLPLPRSAGITRALALHRKGWTWTAIANVMGEYHGLYYVSGTWRQWCRSAGAAPRQWKGAA
jgi:hypothetical protein